MRARRERTVGRLEWAFTGVGWVLRMAQLPSNVQLPTFNFQPENRD